MCRTSIERERERDSPTDQLVAVQEIPLTLNMRPKPCVSNDIRGYSAVLHLSSDPYLLFTIIYLFITFITLLIVKKLRKKNAQRVEND